MGGQQGIGLLEGRSKSIMKENTKPGMRYKTPVKLGREKPMHNTPSLKKIMRESKSKFDLENAEKDIVPIIKDGDKPISTAKLNRQSTVTSTLPPSISMGISPPKIKGVPVVEEPVLQDDVDFDNAIMFLHDKMRQAAKFVDASNR